MAISAADESGGVLLAGVTSRSAESDFLFRPARSADTAWEFPEFKVRCEDTRVLSVAPLLSELDPGFQPPASTEELGALTALPITTGMEPVGWAGAPKSAFGDGEAAVFADAAEETADEEGKSTVLLRKGTATRFPLLPADDEGLLALLLLVGTRDWIPLGPVGAELPVPVG